MKEEEEIEEIYAEWDKSEKKAYFHYEKVKPLKSLSENDKKLLEDPFYAVE